MFQRYTEPAGRVIFYARYEASQFGSPEIETEHLLLGLLRESAAILTKYLQRPIGIGVLGSRIRQRLGERPPYSVSVDLPLTTASKRVLSYSAEEADDLGHKHIGTEHLFLGLLREEKSLAAEVLREHGASLKQARNQLRQAGPWPVGPWKDQSEPVAGSMRGWGTGSGGSTPRSSNLRLIAEDGTQLAEISWQGRLSRLPQIGEALEVERSGEKMRYRLLDVVWQVGEIGEALGHTGHIVLKVRAED